MAVKKAENEPDADALISRRNNTSLHSAATTAAAARDAEGGEYVVMKVMLSRLIDTVFTFNLTFLTVMKITATSQRCLLTRKYQNKFFIILQE
ncbi:hypothetical protein BDFG_07169 [Blastomyces dermatitidis ATCC 26199]|nr:hypothetical protein BDFG_07169 [Blastomyces dermatitidis ATCC 26199]